MVPVARGFRPSTRTTTTRSSRGGLSLPNARGVVRQQATRGADRTGMAAAGPRPSGPARAACRGLHAARDRKDHEHRDGGAEHAASSCPPEPDALPAARAGAVIRSTHGGHRVNCQDISHLLDANAPEALTRAQRATIDRHLASCPVCSEDWANLREIAALPVPAMSSALRGRIAAALSAQIARPPRRAFRPFFVGGLVLAGAALAAALALRFAGRGLESAPVPGAVSRAAVSAMPKVAEAAVPESATVSGQSSKGLAAAVKGWLPQWRTPRRRRAMRRSRRWRAPTWIRTASLSSRDRRRRLTRRPARWAERCHDALVGELRALGGVKVVIDAAVYTSQSYGDTLTLPERDRTSRAALVLAG